MKRLYLVRHAKSSWRDPDIADFDRPLNKRGQRDAPRMGRRMARGGHFPELMITSPAVRALTTARIIAAELDYPDERIITERRLYLADAPEILQIIAETGDSVSRLMVVGHNPGFTDLANRLGGDLDNLPTSGIFCVDCDVASWNDLPSGTNPLFFDYPKRLDD